AAGTVLLGTGTASKDGDLTITLTKQFVDTKVMVSVTNYNSKESEKVELTVADEAVTELPSE
ncbi:MAG: hypothetical protein ACQET8_06185, partial [Bacillota bacterium]